MAAGLSAAGVAILALSLMGRASVPAEVEAPVKTAANAVRPLIPPESFAGPTGAALAPDSRAVLQAVLKKAGLRPTLDPHRLSWDQARRVNAVMPPDRSIPDLAQPFHLDVSAKNDWSKVRVWDMRSNGFGAHVYAVSGFIAKELVKRASND